MTKILTKRKQKWVNQFNPDLVQGLPLQPSAAVEMRYYKRLHVMIDRMCSETEKELKRLFHGEAAEQYFAMDASIAEQAKRLTNKLIEKFDRMFAEATPDIADSFIEASDKASSAAMHESMQKLSGGMSLPTSAITAPMKEVLKASINENVALIKSIPAKYMQDVQGAVMRSITSGNGLQDLVPFLNKHKGITTRRARMIANDQTRKAFNNLNRGRMEKLGIERFKWLHTGGSNEPRRSHIELSGKIFSFDDLPVIDNNTGERGIPGQAINCRCRMVPVIEFKGDDDE